MPILLKRRIIMVRRRLSGRVIIVSIIYGSVMYYVLSLLRTPPPPTSVASTTRSTISNLLESVVQLSSSRNNINNSGPNDWIPLTLFDQTCPRRMWTMSMSRNDISFHNAIGSLSVNTDRFNCSTISSVLPQFAVQQCISRQETKCGQGYFAITRLDRCPIDNLNKTLDSATLSPSKIHADHFLNVMGSDGFYAEFLGQHERYAIENHFVIELAKAEDTPGSPCRVTTILPYDLAMPGKGTWVIYLQYSDWQHVNETDQMGWPKYIGDQVVLKFQDVCPSCGHQAQQQQQQQQQQRQEHRQVAVPPAIIQRFLSDQLPICPASTKDMSSFFAHEERGTLKGTFISDSGLRIKEAVTIPSHEQKHEALKWSPYGCRLRPSSLLTSLKSASVDKVVEPKIRHHHHHHSAAERRRLEQRDDVDENFDRDKQMDSEKDEEDEVRDATRLATNTPSEDESVDRSILLIGDSHLRVATEFLVRAILLDESHLNRVEEKMNNAKSQPKSSILGPDGELLKYDSKTWILSLESPTFKKRRVKIRIQHQFDPFLEMLGNMTSQAVSTSSHPALLLDYVHYDSILFNFGFWPASGKVLGGHWHTTQYTDRLEEVLQVLERLQTGYKIHHHSRSGSTAPPLRFLWMGVPAAQPRADPAVIENEDWKNNFRLGYWSNLAEKLMLAKDIPSVDSFGITLPMVNESLDGIHFLNNEGTLQ